VTNTGNYAEVNGGSGSRIEFIANGEDVVSYQGDISFYQNSQNVLYVAIGESATTASISSIAHGPGSGIRARQSLGRGWTPSEGYQYLSLLARIDLGSATITADLTRNGAATDPPCSFISAEVSV
jgi:hypothetical protein